MVIQRLENRSRTFLETRVGAGPVDQMFCRGGDVCNGRRNGGHMSPDGGQTVFCSDAGDKRLDRLDQSFRLILNV